MTDDHGMEHATLTLASAIACLAESLDHAAASLQALKLPAGAPSTTSGPPVASGGLPGPSQKTPQQKMSGKVFAICKTNGWSIGEIGQRALGKPMADDSRTWSIEELKQTLDQLAEWGFA